MHVDRLHLTNFRVYRELSLELPPGAILLSGGNAQGKTSLLEALYVLATTRAPHAVPDKQLVSWAALGDVTAHTRVAGRIAKTASEQRIDVVWVQAAGRAAEPRITKHIRVDGTQRRPMDALGILNVVLFTPHDIDLVSGPPSERRRYLDIFLCQVDPAYCRTLSSYNRLLAQRNQLLRNLRERAGRPAELDFWDDRHAGYSAAIVSRRAAALEELASLAAERYATISDRAPDGALDVRYSAPLADTAAGESEMTDRLREALHGTRSADIRRGATGTGPHRDDLAFTVGGRDARAFASRGQQRSIALSLRLAEAELMRRRTGDPPVLLMDDVFAELDPHRRDQLFSLLQAEHQVIATTADADNLPPRLRGQGLNLTVDAGHITPALQVPTPHPSATQGDNNIEPKATTSADPSAIVR